MKSSLHCLPCFLQQTIKAARLSTPDPLLQKEIIDAVALLLPSLDLNRTPPENSMPVYEAIAELSGCADPFLGLKEESNRLARQLMADIANKISASADPLATALLFSIAGNIIDYGSQQNFDAEHTLRQCLARPLAINDYQSLRRDLANSGLLLYLADNAGEIIFDSLVVQELQRLWPTLEIVFVVKERPIINDALPADARACGIPARCTVITNGTACPGTPLADCSAELQGLFAAADVIISKGQGNYETLSETGGPLYFLLTVKCPVVGRHIAEQSGVTPAKGDLVLMQGRGTRTG